MSAKTNHEICGSEVFLSDEGEFFVKIEGHDRAITAPSLAELRERVKRATKASKRKPLNIEVVMFHIGRDRSSASDVVTLRGYNAHSWNLVCTKKISSGSEATEQMRFTWKDFLVPANSKRLVEIRRALKKAQKLTEQLLAAEDAYITLLEVNGVKGESRWGRRVEDVQILENELKKALIEKGAKS